MKNSQVSKGIAELRDKLGLFVCLSLPPLLRGWNYSLCLGPVQGIPHSKGGLVLMGPGVFSHFCWSLENFISITVHIPSFLGLSPEATFITFKSEEGKDRKPYLVLPSLDLEAHNVVNIRSSIRLRSVNAVIPPSPKPLAVPLSG